MVDNLELENTETDPIKRWIRSLLNRYKRFKWHADAWWAARWPLARDCKYVEARCAPGTRPRRRACLPFRAAPPPRQVRLVHLRLLLLLAMGRRDRAHLPPLLAAAHRPAAHTQPRGRGRPAGLVAAQIRLLLRRGAAHVARSARAQLGCISSPTPSRRLLDVGQGPVQRGGARRARLVRRRLLLAIRDDDARADLREHLPDQHAEDAILARAAHLVGRRRLRPVDARADAARHHREPARAQVLDGVARAREAPIEGRVAAPAHAAHLLCLPPRHTPGARALPQGAEAGPRVAPCPTAAWRR